MVRRVVAVVLQGERTGRSAMSVTFLTPSRMRTLNRRSLGYDRVTDVIAFRLAHDEVIMGDIYICPAMAQAAARRLKISRREELIRLIVHGTLHVLGFDHPSGVRRLTSPMWRRQERYVRRLVRKAA